MSNPVEMKKPTLQLPNFIIASILVIIVVTALFMLARNQEELPAEPIAVQGMLDLTNWDMKSDGVVDLKGEWEFYWNQLLTSADLADNTDGSDNAVGTDNEVNMETTMPSKAQLVQVPNVWTDYEVDGTPYPGEGYATYRLQVQKNGGTNKLGLRIPDMSTACRIMINGDVVAECGTVADREELAVAKYAPQTIQFETSSNQIEIIVQISNYLYDRGGMWYSMELGTPEQISKLRENEMAMDLILLGVFLFMGLYHLAFYMLRPKEKVALLFAIGCLIGALRLFVVDDMFLLNVIPNAPIEWIIGIIYFTYYGGVTVLTLYLRELYPQEISKLPTTIVVWFSSAFLLTIFVLPVSQYTYLIRYYHYFMLLLGFYLIGRVLLAVWHKRDGSRLQFFGISFFVLTIFHDIFFNLFYISELINHANTIQFLKRQVVLLGLFVLVFIQAIVLARRFSHAFHTMERMSERLVSLDRLKDEFLVNTSHELKTPLHGIMNLSQSMIEGSNGPMNEAQQHNLSVIVSVARRLTNLIQDILDFSKLNNNEIILHKVNVSIQAIMQANIEVFRHYAAEKPITLQVQIPQDLPMVYADENRLLQILYNIIGNAIKFTEQGTILISAGIIGEMIEVRVSDTGIGIPKEKQDLIFNSFEQVGSSVSREYGGAGLGLSITKKLVEMSGGVIMVDSKEGVGSSFSFTIPISVGQTQSTLLDQAPKLSSPDQLSDVLTSDQENDSIQYTILAVDDDPTNLQVLVNVLAKEPYHIILAHDGEEALNILGSVQNIDLVILDVMMPRLSGYEVTRVIRERFTLSELPILLVTVKNEPEDLFSGFSAGANDFLIKPFYMHELQARVRTLLALKRSVEEVIESKLDFLRAQIKPHFLYNALNTIVGICPRDPKQASYLLTELSHYLRGSFDFQNNERFVSLEKERDLIQSYVVIEQARFEERLKVVYDWDETVSVLIPPLSIQPLVENAIRHGVMKRVSGGTVTIRVKQNDSYVYIVVEDDGVGVSEHQLSTLLAPHHQSGVGLLNIHQRMKRIYGTSLEVDSVLGSGTKVTLTIPKPSEEVIL